jgi:hypothetical protein
VEELLVLPLFTAGEEPLEEELRLTDGADLRLVLRDVLTFGTDCREELTLEADFVFGAELRETEGAGRLEVLLLGLTVDRLWLLWVDTVADFFGAEVLAERVTIELLGVLRTALVFGLTDELFVLLLCTASCLTERVAPIFAGVAVLVLADRVVVVALEGFTAELRVAPVVCLTEEFVVLRVLLTVADFFSALLRELTAVLFLRVAEDLAAERVPALLRTSARDLCTAVELFVLDRVVEAFLTVEEFLPEFFLA